MEKIYSITIIAMLLAVAIVIIRELLERSSERDVKEICPDPFKDKVKCEECKCWVDKLDAKKVTYLGYGMVHYYCQSHKKPYNEVLVSGMFGNNSGRNKYYGEIEMDEKGNPIKK